MFETHLRMNELIKQIEALPRPGRLKVLKFLVDSSIKISESSDGCRVNLDTLNQLQLSTLKIIVNELIKPIPTKYLI